MWHVTFILALLSGATVVFGWLVEARRHTRQIESIPLRIHVNGIRGKSTVTRILAGMLRQEGIRTVAKCTGSAAVVIHPDGSETPIRRRGAATILEQIDVIRKYVPGQTEAIVVECMALQPYNQAVSERQIVRSNVGVITNVREDHQDVMGETLSEIARSLLNTCPYGGLLVTSEQNAEILAVMREECDRRGSRLLVADPDDVSEEDLLGFPYVSFKENVAIGAAISRFLDIPRDVAMRGMQGAAPDPGSLILKHLRIGEKLVTWANLLAVNDRESTIVSMRKLEPYRTGKTTTIGLLNNRSDRPQRALQFAEIAALDLDLDRLALLGAYEHVVAQRLIDQYRIAPDRVIRLGANRNPNLPTLIQRLVHDQPTRHVMLVGMVNIHTEAADLLREYLEGTTALH